MRVGTAKLSPMPLSSDAAAAVKKVYEWLNRGSRLLREEGKKSAGEGGIDSEGAKIEIAE